MADQEWLWDDPIGIPDAEDIGPALSDREIAAWEVRHGVSLPPILKRAYRQQDGGYIRGSERGITLLRLDKVEPVGAEYMDDAYWEDEDGQFDPARLFHLGGDDSGANVLLYYGEPGDAKPAVYAHYTDGGLVERLADTVDGLFGVGSG